MSEDATFGVVQGYERARTGLFGGVPHSHRHRDVPGIAPVPPGDPGLSPSTPPDGTSAKPRLVMGQRYGDGYTVYVVHGSGFVPLTQVQVRLTGHGVASFRPTADQRGTFNYAIDQGHLFFPGAIPPGSYHVLVTGASGRRATTSFVVHPPGPPPAATP